MRAILTVLIPLLVTSICHGDGKLYSRERVPPGIPYQRALILYDEGRQTLVLQSKFETGQGTSTDSMFGWVVPVPSEPELAGMSAMEARRLFERFDRVTKPQVIKRGEQVAAVAFALILLTWAGVILVVVLSFGNTRLRSFVKKHGVLFRYGLYGTPLLLILTAVLTPNYLDAGGMRVEIIHAEQVGIYDAQIVKSDSSSALIAWLRENGFEFTDSDTPVFDSYVEAGWCFVVAHVRPEERDTAGRVDGLIDPVIMRFETDNAVYPLALTSTIGVNTEVLIYFLSKSKADCGGRMNLHYAGPVSKELLTNLGSRSADHFDTRENSLDYLTKFKGTLTPEQMRKDLTFIPATNTAPYRERIVRW